MFQVDLSGVVEADLELCRNCWSAGFLKERQFGTLSRHRASHVEASTKVDRSDHIQKYVLQNLFQYTLGWTSLQDVL